MSSLEGKRVLIAGMDDENRRLAHWLPTQGANVIVADDRDAGELADDLMEFILEPSVSFAMGGHGLDLMDDVDMLCVSGHMPLHDPILRMAYERNLPIKNEAILFMENCPARVIGIAGSLGKSTTSHLVHAILSTANKQVWGGGDYIPLFDLPDMQADDYVVLELRNTHIENSSFSPNVGVLMNMLPVGIDRYDNIDAYASALSNLYNHQRRDELFVYNRDDNVAATMADLAPAEHAAFSTHMLVSDGACFAGNRLILSGIASPTGIAKVVCDDGEISLLGEHNLSNVAAACAITGSLGILPEHMREVITTIKGVPNRLEYVTTLAGATWINDSVAISPERTMLSLSAIRKRPLTLILGGRDYGYDWRELGVQAALRAETVVCFGEHGGEIADVVGRMKNSVVDKALKAINVVENVEDAVNAAYRSLGDGGLVLFSPGGSPDDAYMDFAERGEAFRHSVDALASES